MNLMESHRISLKEVCSECGQVINDQTKSYLMECDRCLSKRHEE